MNSQFHSLEFLLDSKKFIIMATKNRKLQFKIKGIIQLPHWTTYQLFQILKKYCQDTLDPQIIYKSQILQKLLWLGDSLGLQKFQEFVINRLIIPHIGPDNCLLFLIQAYKKLNTDEDDTLIAWYQMLNISMNITAKNIEYISQNNLQQLNKIDQKIIEEIIERSFKFKKSRNQRYNIIRIIKNMRIYQFSALLDILNQRKKIITQKRIYQQNSANIIKSINLKSEKKQKQTNPFILSDYSWILITRKTDNNLLRIYLKLLQSQNLGQRINNEIVCVYYHSRIESNMRQKNYCRSNLVMQVQAQLLVSEFSIIQFKNNNKQRIQFGMFISIDYTSSCILNYIRDNTNKFFVAQLIMKYSLEDFKSILQSLKHNHKNQQELLEFLIEFNYHRQIENLNQYIQQIQFQNIETDKLRNFIVLHKKGKPNFIIMHYLEKQLHSRLNIHPSNPYYQNSSTPIIANQPYLKDNPTPLNNIQNIHKQKNYRNSRISNKSEILFNKSSKKINQTYANILQRIDIRNFIRSKNSQMISHFDLVDSLKKM